MAEAHAARASIREDLLAKALRTPLVRSEIEAFAKSESPTSDDVADALARGEAHAATILAFAMLAAGRLVATPVVRKLLPDLPELPDADLLGPFARAAEGGTVEALTGFLSDGRGSWVREALAFLLIAVELDGKPADPKIVQLARRFARRQLDPTEKAFFGTAVARLGDAGLSSLAAKDVKAAARQKRMVEEVIQAARKAPLDVIPTVVGPRVIAVDYTVRKPKEAGRNDPCPCGSGKKYKKCCALKTETAVTSAAAIEGSALHPEQASLLKPAQLTKLETSRLAPRVFVAAYDRVLQYRLWDVVARMFEEAKARPDLEPSLESLRVATLHEAFEAREIEIAERVYATLSPEEAAFDALEMAMLKNEADVLARIDGAAKSALHTEDDGAHAVELAYTLLRHYPALGIFVARGALHERRKNDCKMLLEVMEDARDKLLVAPFEPWWDLYERMVDAADERDDELRQSAEQKKLADALRAAHKEQRRATSELTKLKTRLDELDAAEKAKAPPAKTKATKASGPAAPTPPPVSVDPQIEEERRLLRTKVAELRRIVTEGQEERRELRQKLADAERDDGDELPADLEAHIEGVDEPEDDDEGDGRSTSVDAPRNVSIPRFEARAQKSITALDPAAADGALSMVAALAAGRPNAWAGTKHLTKVKNLMSARAGLYHRILFAIEDRALVVYDVVPRKELEQALVRLAAERGHRS